MNQTDSSATATTLPDSMMEAGLFAGLRHREEAALRVLVQSNIAWMPTARRNAHSSNETQDVVQKDFTFGFRRFDSFESSVRLSAFDWHLRLCRDCRSYPDSYAPTVKLDKLADASEDDPGPSDVPDDLVKAILPAHKD